jgi:type VI secretion system Hcp family effector
MADIKRYRFTVTSPAAKVSPQASPSAQMVNVPVTLILAALKSAEQRAFPDELGMEMKDRPGTAPKHQFAVDELGFGLDSSGGKRTFEPVTLLKATGGSTPLLYEALVESEKLTTAIFDCYGQDKDGKTVLAATVKLSDARVTELKLDLPDLREHSKASPRDRISLAFAQIDVVFASKTFSDSWS